MLFTQAYDRERREAAEAIDRLTLGVNNGLAIRTSKDAMRQFELARSRRAAADEPSQSPAEFRATMGRLAARFPGNVTVH